MALTKESQKASIRSVTKEPKKWDKPHYPHYPDHDNNNNKECPSDSVEVNSTIIMVIYRYSFNIEGSIIYEFNL